MLNNIAVLHFEELLPIAENDCLKYDLVITYDKDMGYKSLNDMVMEIKAIKESADFGEPYKDFVVPSYWDELGWDEKINFICHHLRNIRWHFDFTEFETISIEIN